MRGVHLDKTFSLPYREGSSPHARGPPPSDYIRLMEARIIPACAGSTMWEM